MENLRISLFQSQLHWENSAANRAHFDSQIAQIQGTDLILLPEMFSTGFSMNAAAFAEEMDGPTLNWMAERAAKQAAVLCGSLMIREKGRFHNRLIWMRPDGSYEQYDKRHLFGLGEEDKTFSRGQKHLIVELNGWKICPMICYDLRFPVWSRNTINNDSPAYDLLIYTANWPQKRIHHWESLLPARAVENQCYVIGLNRWGYDGNEIYHDGRSMVIDPDAKILWKGQDAEEGVTLSLDAHELALKRRQLPFLKDADRFQLEI